MKTLLIPFVLAALLPPGTAAAQATGSVVGTLALKAGPARKWASRYPGSGATVGEMHAVSPVVYLVGDLPPAPPADTELSIAQVDGRFVPDALVVRTGTLVRFPNSDPFYHNVFSYSGPRFDLGRYPSGESREVRLDEPGILRVYCEIHQFMRAVVVVTDHGFAAVVGDDGRFRLDGVPPGRYTVMAYHPDLHSAEAEVTVVAGATARVDLEMAR